MLGEEPWKHKDFSSSPTFSMLEPKPILCNSCTTNSEPPLLWCISAANARSKRQSMVFGLASLISAWPIAAIFTSFGFDWGEQSERMKKMQCFRHEGKHCWTIQFVKWKKGVSLISKTLLIWSSLQSISLLLPPRHHLVLVSPVCRIHKANA